MRLLPLFTLPLVALAQTASTPTFSAAVVPNMFAVYGQYNQLSTAGSPWTGGIAAVYEVSSSAGLFMTTCLDLSPRYAVDPTTSKRFLSLSGSFRQGLHKVMWHPGKAAFLVGADVGPSFASPGGMPSNSILVSASSSFVVTAFYQVTKVLGAILPIRMLYVDGVGWNPVVEAGVTINIGKVK